MTMTHAQTLPPFCELRKLIQLAADECGAYMSNTRSKVLAQAMINRSEGWDYSTICYSDPVGEQVARKVTAWVAARRGDDS